MLPGFRSLFRRNDEAPMTKAENNAALLEEICLRKRSTVYLCHSFVTRHSDFVILG